MECVDERRRRRDRARTGEGIQRRPSSRSAKPGTLRQNRVRTSEYVGRETDGDRVVAEAQRIAPEPLFEERTEAKPAEIAEPEVPFEPFAPNVECTAISLIQRRA